MPALRLICFVLIASLFSNEEIATAPPLAAESARAAADGYTINYNTVSMIEYVRFASKICKTNFIYEEADLNFTVTVVSDEPATPENVMATLIQVLRIHGLLLLEQDNNLVIHKSADVRQAATLVTDASHQTAPIITRIFRIKNAKPESIAAVVQPMISTSALLEVSPETRQLILTDIRANVDKIALLIENLDSPHTLFEIKSFATEHNTPEYLMGLANQIMAPLTQGNPFILVPQNAARALFIVSTPELVQKAVDVLTRLDLEPKANLGRETAFVYRAVHRPSEDILKGLEDISSNLSKVGAADSDLTQVIQTAKAVHESNSILFVGTTEAIAKVKEFLNALDIAPGGTAGQNGSFFIYKPQHRTPEEVQSAILEMAANLNEGKSAPKGLIDTIQTVKINPLTHTLSFSGEEGSFRRVQELLATIDTPTSKSAASIPIASQFYIYRPTNQTGDQIATALKEVTMQLKADKLADPALLATLGTMKWIKSTNSLMFTGDPGSLVKVQALIKDIDAVGRLDKPGYFLYRVQNTTGDLIEEDLDNLAKNFASSGLKDSKILDVIDKMRYVKQTNSFLLSGDPQAVEEVKELIAQYDYPRKAAPLSSNFYMYKPQHLPSSQVEKSLKEVSSNLKNAGLADPSLLKTIDTAKYVETTNSLIFTGPPDTLVKVQEIMKDIDTPPKSHAPIQHVGKTTFLLYKLKYAGGPQIVDSVKAVAADLKKNNGSDKEFIKALQTMKYVKETNSLFFSGPEDALAKVQSLVEQFDVTSLKGTRSDTLAPTSGPSNFFVYRPQSLAGPDLEHLLQDFSDHLKSSGLYDPELFQSISSMRWTDKTQTLVFTGTPKALDQVKELLRQFDIPSNLPPGSIAGNGESAIQAIDNTSFLVYKLQFHKGDEIQGALRQIAKDLMISNAPVNQGLLNAINSIQWLEVTNSLLCSGDQETLTRLKELIKNLDIPLKQVFIEMLVIQTNLTNALTFGLEWGGNYKYRNKFGSAGYNSQPIYTQPGSSAAPSTFLQNLSGLVPPSPPTPIGTIPPSSGFDLGIIGEVIRHNGDTFLTLGSLLTALQTDDETTIVMTPKIITQDGRTSTIFVGENIPFVGSFVQNNGQNVVNTSNLEYRDIGFSLTVTPVLGNSDIVTLDINLDRSQTTTDITGSAINFNSQSAQGIITSKTTMQTTVHVPDNNFLILSGMVNNSTAKSKAGIPCLGGLPLVGAAFSKNNDIISNSNIVIFIRPHIINSAEDMHTLSVKEEAYFRDQAGTPYLEHHFDEAMELIKTVDDD